MIKIETQIEENVKTNVFRISFTSSLVLTFIGVILFFVIGSSPGIILIGLLSMVVGGIQVFIDIGFIFIVKINRDLPEWNSAYKIVASQREQKFFMYPVFIDILFIFLSLGTVIMTNV